MLSKLNYLHSETKNAIILYWFRIETSGITLPDEKKGKMKQ